MIEFFETSIAVKNSINLDIFSWLVLARTLTAHDR